MSIKENQVAVGIPHTPTQIDPYSNRWNRSTSRGRRKGLQRQLGDEGMKKYKEEHGERKHMVDYKLYISPAGETISRESKELYNLLPEYEQKMVRHEARHRKAGGSKHGIKDVKEESGKSKSRAKTPKAKSME
jgi:hypothetical protein